jgi:ABC-type transport system involved in multi-copper enzyme maturation permease subunit
MSTSEPTTATTTPARTLDVSGTPRVPFTRLVAVELRKMYDTRAGFWLLISIAAITALAMILLLLVGHDVDQTFLSFMRASATPQGFLLPVLGVLLVTSEWSQRTTLTTFALEPSRSRVVAAKVTAALALGIVAVAVALLVAALATSVAGGTDPWKHIGLDDVGKFTILQVSGILMGLAFGMLLLNSAAAIVLYYVLPTAFSIITSIWTQLHDVQPWIDTGTSQAPLFDGVNLTGEQWAHLATSSALWIGLPLLVGLWRIVRAEVK